MKINKSVGCFVILLLSSPAFAGDETVIDVLIRLANLLFQVGTLISVGLVLLGMYSLAQLIAIFIIKDEQSKELSMGKVPFYFIGAALGLGTLMTNDVINATVFGGDAGHVSLKSIF